MTSPTSCTANRPSHALMIDSLFQERLVEIGRLFGVPIDLKPPRLRILDLLVTATRTSLADVLATLTRDELRAACRMHALDHVERSRDVLVARLLQAAGETPTPAALALDIRGIPRVGDIVR